MTRAIRKAICAMHICLVTSSYPRFEQDGNARFIRSIAEAQADLGHEVHVLAPYHSSVRPYESSVKIHWFRYIAPARWGIMGHAQALENDRRLRAAALWQAPLFGPSLVLSLQRIIRRYKIDLVHAHWVIPSGFLAGLIASLNNIPLFISLHGSDMYVARRTHLLRSIGRWALCQARGITACSSDLADSATQLGAMREKTRLIPWGADTKQFVAEGRSLEILQKLKMAVEYLVIVAAGRLVEKKGFALLVQAMPAVLEVVANARLVILGEGPERRNLERMKTELGLDEKVSLPGNVPWSEVPAYLSTADVFVMPSIRDANWNMDGLPTVILEAMAASRAVIATRVGGIPLVVQDNDTGILIDDATPKQLSRALIRLLSSRDERIAMGRAGRALIEKELNWMTVARRFDQMYHEAM